MANKKPLEQIPLDLTPVPNYSFERFEVGASNRLAVRALKAWPAWPAPILVIYGKAGVGKTHLGKAWAYAIDGLVLTGASLSRQTEFKAGAKIVLDQAEASSDVALFNLMNLALNGDIAGLLLSSRVAPQNWAVSLPDLQSRLRRVQSIYIDEHEDELLEPIIRKLFEDKGRQITRDTVVYMIKHCQRSVSALRQLVYDMDKAALAQKRDLNRHFVIGFLKKL